MMIALKTVIAAAALVSAILWADILIGVSNCGPMPLPPDNLRWTVCMDENGWLGLR